MQGVTVFPVGRWPDPHADGHPTRRGEFRLSGVIAGKVILFARKDGFRFHGQPVDTEAGLAELVLAESREPAHRSRRSSRVFLIRKSWRLPADCSRPYIEKVDGQGHGRQRGSRRWRVLAQVDPARALELIESQRGRQAPVRGGHASQHRRRRLGERRVPDEAVSIAESIQEPGARSWCLTDLVDKLPAAARDRKAELLAQAQLQVRGIKQPGERIRLIGRVAERLA